MLTLLLVLYILMSIQTWLFPLLSLFFFSLLSTRFSRCCSIWESANLVAVVPLLLLLLLLWFLLLLLIVVLLLQLLLPLHVMLVVFVFLFFFVIHNADASSTDIDPHASGRSPQTSRICSGAYVATDVSTELE